MPQSLLPENLTIAQSEALERAAYLIIVARKEAAAILAGAGLDNRLEPGWFGSPCMAKADVGIPCACNEYKGEGGPCMTLITTDPPTNPPTRSCGHPPSAHVPT